MNVRLISAHANVGLLCVRAKVLRAPSKPPVILARVAARLVRSGRLSAPVASSLTLLCHSRLCPAIPLSWPAVGPAGSPAGSSRAVGRLLASFASLRPLVRTPSASSPLRASSRAAVVPRPLRVRRARLPSSLFFYMLYNSVV